MFYNNYINLKCLYIIYNLFDILIRTLLYFKNTGNLNVILFKEKKFYLNKDDVT